MLNVNERKTFFATSFAPTGNSTYQQPMYNPFKDGPWESTRTMLSETRCSVWGDVNNNGEVTLVDMYILREALKKQQQPACVRDLNGDGTINEHDVTALQNYITSSTHRGYTDPHCPEKITQARGSNWLAIQTKDEKGQCNAYKIWNPTQAFIPTKELTQ